MGVGSADGGWGGKLVGLAESTTVGTGDWSAPLGPAAMGAANTGV